jgi:hypothetical protein
LPDGETDTGSRGHPASMPKPGITARLSWYRAERRCPRSLLPRRDRPHGDRRLAQLRRAVLGARFVKTRHPLPLDRARVLHHRLAGIPASAKGQARQPSAAAPRQHGRQQEPQQHAAHGPAYVRRPKPLLLVVPGAGGTDHVAQLAHRSVKLGLGRQSWSCQEGATAARRHRSSPLARFPIATAVRCR